tara:strand:+ start:3184 stop:3558 length:375 start_codon:yes stop_codon:yes gene_type:complete
MMQKVESIEELPHPVRAMARNFLESDINEPEIYEVVVDEYDVLASNQDVVTQLLYWRTEKKFYAVLAGDAERKIVSDIIYHDPFKVKRSILAFYEVDSAAIKLWQSKYKKKSLNEDILEFNEES